MYIFQVPLWIWLKALAGGVTLGDPWAGQSLRTSAAFVFAYTIALVGVAVLAHHAIEQPARRWLRGASWSAVSSAEEGNRTPTPRRAADFESAASASSATSARGRE